MKRLKNILLNLCSIPAVTGDERTARGLLEQLRPLCDGIRQMPCGSIIAVKRCGKPDAPKLMLDAHIDQIGLMVTEMDKNGFIHFINHAGVDPKILLGTPVTILGKKQVPGVISAKPPHLLSAEEREKPAKIEDMTIDVGLSLEEAQGLIRVGDKIALDAICSDMLSGRLTGRSLDDRAGCAVLISLLELLSHTEFTADVYICLSAGEEFGGFGVAAATLEIAPDELIAIDVSHADMPAARKEDCGVLGKGAMIGISPVLDAGMSEELITLARRNGIAYQIEAMGGATWTNADTAVPLCGGIPAALLSIPLRYMHTPQEVIDIADLISLRDLLLSYVRKERV